MPLDVREILKAAAPVADRAGRVDSWSPFITSALLEFEIATVPSVCAILATFLHESGGLRYVEENLNYDAAGLVRVWPSRFPTHEFAAGYAFNPERIASRAYANRMGNGSEASGDGWRNRGRGLIQVTGAANLARCLNGLGKGAGDADYLLTQEGAARSGAWFWRHGATNRTGEIDLDAVMNEDRGVEEAFATTQALVNGMSPPHGWEERLDYFRAALAGAREATGVDSPVYRTPAAPRALRLGYHGDDVAAVQRMLGGVEVDGYFGPRTAYAVIEFQKTAGLDPDGIVGPLTLAKLESRE